MAAYVTQTEVNSMWESSLKSMIRDCKVNKKIPEELVELVKHNLYAKYVYYDDARENIEFGVNKSKGRVTSYPLIKVYCFPISEIGNLLLASFEPKKRDFEFYAKLFTGRNFNDRIILL